MWWAGKLDWKGLREVNRQWMLENRALRKVFSPKTEKVGAGWRKLLVHNEELYDCYFRTGIMRVIESRRMKCVWVALYIKERVLVGKPEGKRLLGRPMGWWENDIKIELKGIGWNVVNWLREGTENWDFLDYLRR
jgi:hypothetical protein